jgi:hypothetical protein
LRSGLGFLFRLPGVLLFFFGLFRGSLDLVADDVAGHRIDVDFMQAIRGANVKGVDQLAMFFFQFPAYDLARFSLKGDLLCLVEAQLCLL